ncbi:lipoyl synthase [Sporomusa sp.]|uniref:lipoyl synthase n=1 Tax=Sporomusa sp. TaxID=2078658 RepID=UPI002B569C85|nr:lipoyl synthase [Sporomusa sp.]HWR44167.1 lipoyl synthase [Sporomusa sp.]
MHTDRPQWLTLPVPEELALNRMKELLDQGRLHTVCESADCPNIGECFGNKTCTFMILGNHCTRNCRFCAVNHGIPDAVDSNEPHMLAATAKHLGLKHVVITSVTRDDLSDGGAGQFAAAIGAVRAQLPKAGIEVLIPDFKGSMEALQTVLQAKPNILNHNIETVPRLYSVVRPQAVYSRSLELINRTSRVGSGILPKSGLMLGLGEEIAEVVEVMKDLYNCGCKMLTLGQYLSPSPDHLPVEEYIHPDVFKWLGQEAQRIGFSHVSAGPMVRSSYHAGYSFAELSQA